MEQFLNKIIFSDCMDILKALPDKSIELVLTDPPYGRDIIKNGKIGDNSLTTVKNYGSETWDSKSPEKIYFDEIFRVSKNQIIFGANYFIEKINKNSPCWIIWDKDNSGDFADAELAWTSFKTPVKIYRWRWNGMIQQDMKNKEIRIHPTQKPVKLFENILFDYYNFKSNGIVADFYSGSGTTAIACYNLGIPFICTENKESYFKDSVKRLEEVKQQGKLFKPVVKTEYSQIKIVFE